MCFLALDTYEEHDARYGYLQRTGVYCMMLGDTRSSPHPSMVALGCLNVRGERGERQSCYSDRLGQRPSTDTVKE
jgi:hypothetical protein